MNFNIFLFSCITVIINGRDAGLYTYLIADLVSLLFLCVYAYDHETLQYFYSFANMKITSTLHL